MKLYIKNMVCPRCIMAVEDILGNLDIQALEVRLGEVILSQDLSSDQYETFRNRLEKIGFELLDDSQQQIIEKIKSIIINQVHYPKDENANFSELLATSFHRDYSYLSKLFSTTEGITIEHFAILQKTEKVKELLTYNQKTLSEIAFEMKYSSVAHLSAQFKKVTGLTPTQFKAQGIILRQTLDTI